MSNGDRSTLFNRKSAHVKSRAERSFCKHHVHDPLQMRKRLNRRLPKKIGQEIAVYLLSTYHRE